MSMANGGRRDPFDGQAVRLQKRCQRYKYEQRSLESDDCSRRLWQGSRLQYGQQMHPQDDVPSKEYQNRSSFIITISASEHRNDVETPEHCAGILGEWPDADKLHA